MHQKCRETEGPSTETAAQAWRQKAAQCRRLAISVADRQTSEALTKLAEEYEREAASLEAANQTSRD